MSKTKASGWVSWIALLAAGLVVPACTMNGGGGGSSGNGPLWASLSGGGGAPAPTGLVWRDVNLGPISGGGGLGGDMTFEQAGNIDVTNGTLTANPFTGDEHPVSVAVAQNATEEQTLEGLAATFYQQFAVSQQNLGGGGLGGLGGGFGGGIGLVPIFGADPKMELEPRADCENCAIQNTATPSETNTAPNSLTWRLIKCGVNANLMNPYSGGPLMAPDATTAWNSMSGTAQTRIQGIQGSGYYGAGYWTLNGNAWYALAIIDLPLGQSP